MNERQKQRIAENEAAFRRVNEASSGMRRVIGHHPKDHFKLICECGAPDCHERIRVRADRYSAVRSNPRRFLVVPGHEIPDVEVVVERMGDVYVVEKPPDVDPIVAPD